MFKTLLSRRSEEPFFLITVLLLIIIAVYNWVIALLALILIGGAYVLTRKNHNERNRVLLMWSHFDFGQVFWSVPWTAWRFARMLWGR